MTVLLAHEGFPFAQFSNALKIGKTVKHRTKKESSFTVQKNKTKNKIPESQRCQVAMYNLFILRLTFPFYKLWE